MSGDRDRAVDLHNQLLLALNVISEASIPLEKEVLAQRGIIETGYCREPVHATPDDSHRETLAIYVEDILDPIEAL